MRLGAWVAPATFGAPPGGAIPVVDVTITGADDAGLHLGLRRHGVPYARVRVGDHTVELDGSVRVTELGWTRLELTLEPVVGGHAATDHNTAAGDGNGETETVTLTDSQPISEIFIRFLRVRVER
jgi:hypothetical protein